MEVKSIQIPAIAIAQPIGEFYVGVMSREDIVQISFADMRRIERELDRYVGIQRKLSSERVAEIGKFVNTIDATFPTSIVLAVPGSCARYDSSKRELVLFEGTDEETGSSIRFFEIAKILDGQHRVEGLKAFSGERFDVPVSIFVDADIADQSYIFATVNLAQTKVNRSLVYDLLEYSRARSPQRTCHDVAVALDRLGTSPFHQLIKRLGTSTPGRVGETLAQATIVNSLLPFITNDPITDRERMARSRKVKRDDSDYAGTPFRWLWIEERDTDIARILIEYFAGIAARWPDAWKSRERGAVLPRTNGFRACMRFLKNVYLHEKPIPDEAHPIVPRQVVADILERVPLQDGDFTIDRFPPGSSGEKKLYDELREATRL